MFPNLALRNPIVFPIAVENFGKLFDIPQKATPNKQNWVTLDNCCRISVVGCDRNIIVIATTKDSIEKEWLGFSVFFFNGDD